MWKVKKPPGRIVLFFFIAVALAGAAVVFDFIKKSNREFNLSQEAALEHAQGLVAATLGDLAREDWSIFHKLDVEKELELQAVPLSIEDERKSYYETRIFFSPDGTHSVNQRRFSEKEMTLGFKLMNTETGETEVISIQTDIAEEGVSIVAPDGYAIETVERVNGIKWNLWNTEYKVIEPENTVVLKNCFPREETVTVSKVVNGQVVKETKEVVVCFPYVPYSDYLHQVDLIETGAGYARHVVDKAFSLLRERGVMSKAFPDKLVADVEALSPRFFERLPLLEQMDLTEFTIDPQKAAERVLVILGANRENAWKYTCNRVDACGWIQFTPRTYRNIRTGYPAARLTTDFEEGAGDHVNSMMEGILLHDDNLAGFVRRYGECIANDPRIEEPLDAAYNGSPRHVWNSLDATLGNNCRIPPDWGIHLVTETRGFMYKLRYLVENDLP